MRQASISGVPSDLNRSQGTPVITPMQIGVVTLHDETVATLDRMGIPAAPAFRTGHRFSPASLVRLEAIPPGCNSTDIDSSHSLPAICAKISAGELATERRQVPSNADGDMPHRAACEAGILAALASVTRFDEPLS